MSELNSISNSFNETLKESNLQNVSIDLAEVFLDNFFEEGIVKDIPILGTVIGLGKASFQIRERLFLKKIIYFISGLKDIDASKRKKMITKIDESKEYRAKVGEKLLYIIDKCADHESAEFVAKLFVAFLDGRISYSEFLKSALIVENTFINDLKWFIKNDWKELPIEEADDIINTGLLEIRTEEIWIQEAQERGDPAYRAGGGEIKTYISKLGTLIREILRK